MVMNVGTVTVACLDDDSGNKAPQLLSATTTLFYKHTLDS